MSFSPSRSPGISKVLKAAATGHRKGQEHWHEVDLSALARECVELAQNRHHLTPEQVRLVVQSVSRDETFVRGDVEQLRSAIGNLLDNAVKYSPNEKKIIVTLTAEGDDILLSVSDKGVGIPRGELKRIFKRFYRVPLRAMSKVKGTGLGLFIVRSIARHHNGDAFAESDGEGRGAVVTLRLPKVKA